MSIATEINEADYCIAGILTAFMPDGEWGPIACGCCLVALEFDPVGPQLALVMRLKTAEPHSHSLADFPVPL